MVITHFINLENTTSLALVLKEAVNGLINITIGSILYILYLYYFNREKSISYSDIIFVFLTGASIIYSLPDMKLNGVEALIRWKSPEDGLVPPSKFINILEELGLIREVGHKRKRFTQAVYGQVLR